MKLAFVICIEHGLLEHQALLLVKSIRRYAGRFKDAEIYCFNPRNGPSLGEATMSALRTLNAVYIKEVLNDAFSRFPRVNKLFVCSRAEEVIDAEFLVFLDSDSVILNEPVELLLTEQYDVGICPVHSKNIASSGEGDTNDPYWQKLYQLCGAPVPPFITTRVDRVDIRAYWNSGILSVRRKAGVFSEWKQDFLTMMQAEHYPPVERKDNVGIPFLDQTALAATLAKRHERVYELPEIYNYCIPKRPLMPMELARLPLGSLVHVHYHRWFSKKGFLRKIRPKLDRNGERFKWLDQHLPLKPLIRDSVNRPCRTSRTEPVMPPMFFIVGTGRCGTNLLRKMLLLHPDLWITRETHVLTRLQQEFGEALLSPDDFFHVLDSVYMAKGKTAFERIMGFNSLDAQAFKTRLKERIVLNADGMASVADCMDSYYQLLATHNKATFWGDKTPDYGMNMVYLQQLWPQAKFIHIVRDGRDVALSMEKVLSFRLLVAADRVCWSNLAYNKRFETYRAQANGPLELIRFFDLWCERIARTRRQAQQLGADSYMEIDYRDLLSNPVDTMIRIQHFLSLKPNRRWLLRSSRLVDPRNCDKNIKLAEYKALTGRVKLRLEEQGFC